MSDDIGRALSTVALRRRCAELKQERDELFQVVNDLAEWSTRYPRQRVYSSHQQPKMDGELVELEERAVSLLARIKESEE